MEKEEMALELTLKALESNKIELISTNATHDSDILKGANAKNAQLIVNFYKYVLRELQS